MLGFFRILMISASIQNEENKSNEITPTLLKIDRDFDIDYDLRSCFNQYEASLFPELTTFPNLPFERESTSSASYNYINSIFSGNDFQLLDSHHSSSHPILDFNSTLLPFDNDLIDVENFLYDKSEKLINQQIGSDSGEKLNIQKRSNTDSDEIFVFNGKKFKKVTPFEMKTYDNKSKNENTQKKPNDELQKETIEYKNKNNQTLDIHKKTNTFSVTDAKNINNEDFVFLEQKKIVEDPVLDKHSLFFERNHEINTINESNDILISVSEKETILNDISERNMRNFISASSFDNHHNTSKLENEYSKNLNDASDLFDVNNHHTYKKHQNEYQDKFVPSDFFHYGYQKIDKSIQNNKDSDIQKSTKPNENETNQIETEKYESEVIPKNYILLSKKIDVIEDQFQSSFEKIEQDILKYNDLTNYSNYIHSINIVNDSHVSTILNSLHNCESFRIFIRSKSQEKQCSKIYKILNKIFIIMSNDPLTETWKLLVILKGLDGFESFQEQRYTDAYQFLILILDEIKKDLENEPTPKHSPLQIKSINAKFCSLCRKYHVIGNAKFSYMICLSHDRQQTSLRDRFERMIINDYWHGDIKYACLHKDRLMSSKAHEFILRFPKILIFVFPRLDYENNYERRLYKFYIPEYLTSKGGQWKLKAISDVCSGPLKKISYATILKINDIFKQRYDVGRKPVFSNWTFDAKRINQSCHIVFYEKEELA